MQRPLYAFLAVFSLASAILLSGSGCGGGGGSSSGGTDGDNVDPNVAVQRLVAVDSSGRTRDLANTVVGETLTVRALTVSRTGVGTLSDVTELRTSAPSAVATADSEDDSINANSASGSAYTVRATANGKDLSATFRVRDAADRVPVTGIVRTDLGAGIAGATVNFYAASTSEVVASVVTGPNGLYQANIPRISTRFVADVTALNRPATSSEPIRYVYYNVYGLTTDGLNYDATIGCPAPLPALGSGAALGDSVFRRVNSGGTPPGAPTGCKF